MIAFVMAAIFLSGACSPACPPQIWAATAPAIKSDDFNSTHKLNISLPSKLRRKNSTIKCDGLNSTYKTGLRDRSLFVPQGGGHRREIKKSI